MKVQMILNRLSLSGMMILLGVWTAVSDESFSWTETQYFDASTSGSIAINQTSIAGHIPEGMPTEGVTYSLSSVMISISLVPDTNAQDTLTAWTITASETEVLNSLTFTDNYSIKVRDSSNSELILTAQSMLNINSDTEGYVSAPELNMYGVPIDEENPLHLTSSVTSGNEGGQWLTFNADPSNPNSLDSFLGEGTMTLGSYDAMTQTTVNPDDPQVTPLTVTAVPPGMKLMVTITYTVPEPGVLSLLIVGSAFLLRRRKIRLA